MLATETDSVALLTDLRDARAESDRLFEIIRRDHLYDRPIDARHRIIFYVGHLEGFDSIQICRESLGIEPFDPSLDSLFQAGIDPDANHLPSDQPGDWPDRSQVAQYVNRSRAHVDHHLESAPTEVVQMVVEHRLMHLETLAYMFHNLDHASKQAPARVAIPPINVSTPQSSFCEVPAGEAILGKPHDGQFGWDNEFEQHAVSLPAFRIQRFAVTNGEYLSFVKEGTPAPHFWVKKPAGYDYRGMFSDVPLPLDWPVYVTYAEAAAYAKWAGKSLGTEPQFHRAAYSTPSGNTRPFPWGLTRPADLDGNFDFRNWDPEPVTASPETTSAWGVAQLVGNGWEWTGTPFHPFPGFRAHATYPGYSANFFDGEHFVMKGGSARTASCLLRASFRNWFRRDYPYMYAKFRCVENS